MEDSKTEFEELARMIAKGFEGVDKRFEDVREEFQTLKSEISEQLAGVHSRLDSLDRRMDIYTDHERRIRKLEKISGIPSPA